MRKKTILILVDRLFWALILLLPLIILVVGDIHHELTLMSIFTDLGINTNNFIYTALNDMFGSSGVLPLFTSNSSLMIYFTYIVIVELLHLFIDFIIFIPRLSHKWMNSLTGVDEG